MKPAVVDRLELMDWKRRVSELYAASRGGADPKAGWARWRAGRDELFAEHPQSPLPAEARADFRGLPYFDHDPAYRVTADLDAIEPARLQIGTSDGDSTSFLRIAIARFPLPEGPAGLPVYWLEGYGGGLFVPFRDRTAGSESYGAGRYLIDTVKGADLGAEDSGLVLDFNFAYNPSCAYDPQWVCPLAPADSRLDVPVRAGERAPAAQPPLARS